MAPKIKQPARYVHNVETGVSVAASNEILKNLHKKGNGNLRLLPEGWKPGDPVELGSVKTLGGQLNEQQLAEMVKNFMPLFPGASESDIAEKVYQATGQRPAVEGSDSNAVIVPKEMLEKILAILPDAQDDENAICKGGPDKGKPKLAWLRDKCGDNSITDEARDQAWELFQEMM